MAEITFHVTLWLVPPISRYIGKARTSASAPVWAVAVTALHASVRHVSVPPEKIAEIYCVYNRTQQRFLESSATLAAEAVRDGDHLIVSMVRNQNALDERFTPQKPTPFDSTIEDIYAGD